MIGYNDELDQMKRYPLTHVAASLGYSEVSKKSTRSTSFLKHSDTGHKIIVSVRAGSGHYTFFSIGRDHEQAGSCIDLLQLIHGRSFTLGKCRQFMRPFIHGTLPASRCPRTANHTRTLLPTSTEIALVRSNFHRIAIPLESGNNAYLNNMRKLTAETLANPHFARSVYQDSNGRAVFPHRDKHGEITGFASRGPDWKSFSKGGTKSLWFADPGPEERNALCVGEAVISVLSYASLHYNSKTCYLSTEGAMSPLQFELIASAIRKLQEC